MRNLPLYSEKSYKKLPPLKRVMRIDEKHSRLFLEGGMGVYNAANGSIDYERNEKRVALTRFFRVMNKIPSKFICKYPALYRPLQIVFTLTNIKKAKK